MHEKSKERDDLFGKIEGHLGMMETLPLLSTADMKVIWLYIERSCPHCIESKKYMDQSGIAQQQAMGKK
jgi:hypothetical protein